MRALVGEAREDGQFMVTGVGECPSRGVRKGEIIDFDNALSCVGHVLKMAEEQSRVAIGEVHLVVTGGHVQCLVNRGNVPVLSPDGEIMDEDVDQAMQMARAVSLPPERAVLHTICQHFFVDDQEGVLNPEGMTGAKLAVDMLILHGLRNRVRNSVKVLKGAHVEVKDVAFSALCSALAVLTPEQKESGVVLIDLGGGTTDFLVYAGQAIACAGSLTIGGDHITNDIALGLQIPTAQAERLKKTHGSAVLNDMMEGQTVSLPSEGGFPGKFVRLGNLQKIINARVDEMLTMVRGEIEKYDVLSRIGAGVIITGGGTHLDGMDRLVSDTFDLPCNVGMPRNVSGVAVVTEGPDYAAPLGMIRYAFKTGKAQGAKHSALSLIKRVFGFDS